MKLILCKTNGDYQLIDVPNDIHFKTFKKLINCDVIDILQYKDGIDLIIDDEGRISKKETNICLYNELSDIYCFGICGDYLLTRHDRFGNMIGLTNEDIRKLEIELESYKEENKLNKVKEMIKLEKQYLEENPEVLNPIVIELNF